MSKDPAKMSRIELVRAVKSLSGVVFQPTAHLRFIERDGRRILQQAWEPIWTRGTECPEAPEWRDVELVETPDGAPD